MTVKILFSTGKEIELTEGELRELFGHQEPIVAQPFTLPYYPWVQPWSQPYYTTYTTSNS